MAIGQSHYVKITSGVGGVSQVRKRDLILRVFTPSILVSPDGVLEFTSPDGVGAYFGYSSEEYRRAVFYFKYISPSISTPSKLSFARDQSEESVPLVLGTSSTWSVQTIRQVEGGISGTVGGKKFNTGNIPVSTATSLSDISVAITAALQQLDFETFKGCSVVYNPLLARFEFSGGVCESVVVKFTGGELAKSVGLAGGESIKGIAEPLSESEFIAVADDISNNYGSFLLTRKLELTQVIELAMANQAKNVQFIYLVGCTPLEAEEYSAALLSIGSIGLTLIDEDNTDFDEQIPGIIMAATNYNRRNGVTNYMYKQFSGVTPKVTTNRDARKFDKLRINYYGQTQNAGNTIEFYQRGSLMGGGTSPVAMNVHANEQWLKDACAAVLLSQQIALERIPANETGVSLVLTALQQDPIEKALTNGTISRGKSLDIIQKNYITQLTDDENAWMTVQMSGYWLNAWVESYINESGETEYQIVYLLIYGKDDAIRKITGTHVLI